MRVQSIAEIASSEDGVWQVAFDLTGSRAGYLLISQPDDAATAAEFLGHDHYVEVRDQAFGRYGGLASLSVEQDDRLEIGLSYEVAGVGHLLCVTTAAPLPSGVLSRLRKLERQ
jgi:hypothetical protein